NIYHDTYGTMVVNPATGRLYMPNYTGDGALLVADPALNTVTLAAPGPGYQYGTGAAFDPIRNRVYVSGYIGGAYGVAVLDAATDTPVNFLPAFGLGVATN